MEAATKARESLRTNSSNASTTCHLEYINY
jgi:hypothetical protein